MAVNRYTCPVDGELLCTITGGGLEINGGNITINGNLNLVGNVTIGGPGGLSCSRHNCAAVLDAAAAVAAAAAAAAAARQRAEIARQQLVAEQQRLAQEQERQRLAAIALAEAIAKQTALAEELARQQRAAKAAADLLAEQQRAEAARLALLDKTRNANAVTIRALGLQPKPHKHTAKVGHTGTGKSTLFNAMCGLRAGDAGFSETSEGAECTITYHRQPLSGDPCNVLWDLPGANTANHPEATYCRDQCLDMFDRLVLCYHRRVTSVDNLIATYAFANNIPLVVVHTQTDVSVRNLLQLGSGATTPDAALAALRTTVTTDIASRLGALPGCPASGVTVFFVNSLDFAAAAFDEAALLAWLKR
jgi:energy-coupling factor transporter ATP-binding protein EcfA2